MVEFCAITLNWRTSGRAMAGAAPRNMRGRFGPMATARNGEAFSSGTVSSARFSQPSSVDLMDSCTTGRKCTEDGWLYRERETVPDEKSSHLRAIAYGQNLQRNHYGREPA